jgi:hypothetical protein
MQNIAVIDSLKCDPLNQNKQIQHLNITAGIFISSYRKYKSSFIFTLDQLNQNLNIFVAVGFVDCNIDSDLWVVKWGRGAATLAWWLPGPGGASEGWKLAPQFAKGRPQQQL